MLKRALVILAAMAAVFALYLAAFLAVNHQVSARASDVQRTAGEDLPEAGRVLEILIWNVGYGGLGAGSDFVADGGEHMLPPSRRAVRENVAGIESFLISQADADVVLIQELARAGPVNYWIDVRARVEHALRDRDNVFFSDFKTRLLPPPLRLVHGQGIYALRSVESTDIVALPAEDGGFIGVRRRYASPLVRLAGDENWTIVSVHLAAFDEDASVRTSQLRDLMAWAQAEYARGRRVVIGGDWNLQLAATDFPHTTDERHLFWLFPFPDDALPEGWRIAADATIPSVRTNHQPYAPGDNYVTTIDGFVVSPNVEVLSVTGFDLGFAHSDHQPVRLRVRTR
ncbi:MAG: hypothetical protein H7124_12315 [Phycisphaerales bacterium]|nr:hypothetical protein [Hyphomonadaceae bacterium]